jgi:GTP-binding protein
MLMIIKTVEFIKSGITIEHYPQDDIPEFVFLGRSNVGKSTFINMVVGRKNIARTSGKPGKTQTLNFYMVNDTIRFVDVPGYGYAVASKEQKVQFGQMIERYLSSRDQLRLAFLLVDIRHDPTQDDKLMYQYLKNYNKSVVVVATKADKIGKTHITKHINAIKTKLLLSSDDRIIPCSSETNQGISEIHQIIESSIHETAN